MTDALPIFSHLGAIVYRAQKHRVSAVIADTGSGKSTQIPIALLSQGRKCLVSTPTVASARALARFVQSKHPHISVGFAGGGEVHYHVRTHPLVFCTAGHLYRLLMRQCRMADVLSGYDTLVLDEAHTVSLDMDMLECMIKFVWASSKFTLLISSATLDAAVVKQRWRLDGDVFVTEIAVPHLPVTVEYHSTTPEPDHKGNNTELLGTLCRIITERNRTAPEGHFLVFLPGSSDIDKLYDMLHDDPSLDNVEVFPAYSSLPEEDLSRAIDQALPTQGRRSVILSTDVLETSVTIPGVVFVLDSGRQKVMRTMQHDLFGTRLAQEWTSAFSLAQRKGRTGRTHPGTVYRLFTPEQEQTMGQRIDRELDRVPLFSVVVQILFHRLDPLVILPDTLADRVKDSMLYLSHLGLIAADRTLSQEAQFIVNLPLDIPIAVTATRLRAHAHPELALLLAAVLQSVQGTSFLYQPRRNRQEHPQEYEERLMAHHKQYYQRFVGSTDLITMMNIVMCLVAETWELRMSAVRKINGWCKDNSMNAKTVRATLGLYRRLVQQFQLGKENLAAIPTVQVERWMEDVTPSLYQQYAEYALFASDPVSRRWRRVRGQGDLSIPYSLARGVTPKDRHVLALSRHHVVKAGATLGFLSCLVNLDGFLRKAKSE